MEDHLGAVMKGATNKESETKKVRSISYLKKRNISIPTAYKGKNREKHELYTDQLMQSTEGVDSFTASRTQLSHLGLRARCS